MRSIFLATALAIGATACDRSPTEVVLVVNTDYRAPNAIDSIRVEIESLDIDAGTPTVTRTVSVTLDDGGVPANGYTLGIRPSAALDAPFGVAVVGLHGSDVVARYEIRTAFVPHQRRVVNALLTQRCDGWICPASGVCTEGSGGYACNDPNVSPEHLPTEIQCPSGRARCTSPESPLCETDLQSDANNCGACGHSCTTGDHCVAGVCQLDRAQRIAASDSETCALRDNAHVVCWGRRTGNPSGPLEAPHPLNPDFPDVVDISGGRSHMCIVREGGALLCWGDNASGQLGPAVTAASSSDPVMAATPRFTHVGAGDGFTCASTEARGVLCWGRNDHGQCGAPASTTPVRTATAVTDIYGPTVNMMMTIAPINEAINVGAGDDFACAVYAMSSSHMVTCWGNNDRGQCGPLQPATGSEVARRTGSPASGGSVWVTSLAVGSRHACVTHEPGHDLLAGHDGNFWCWGDNASGQLGTGDGMMFRPNPVWIELPNEAVGSVTAFGNSTCAVGASSHAVFCWGSNAAGELATGNTMPYDVPHAMPWHVSDVRAIGGGWSADGSGHACLSHAFGSVRCWGANASGALGIETNGSASLVPLSVPGVP